MFWRCLLNTLFLAYITSYMQAMPLFSQGIFFSKNPYSFKLLNSLIIKPLLDYYLFLKSKGYWIKPSIG